MSPHVEAQVSARLNLAWPFHQRVLAQPERPALWLERRSFSYAELGERAARIAGWLHQADVARGCRVGVLASRSEFAYAGILGAAWAGATYVPLDPKHPEARLIELMTRAELQALIVDDAGEAALTDALREKAPTNILVARTAQESLRSTQPVSEPVAMAADDLAYLMFTSGTTGVPKGVMVSTGNVAHFSSVMQARYRIAPDDRVSQFFELTFDLSVFDLFMAWGGGACLYSIPEAERFAPGNFIRAHALTVWFAVPSAIAFMLRVKALAPGSLPSLRVSLFCGEALPAESAQRWREAAPHGVLENLYGPTEATVACLVEPCSEQIRVTKDRGIVAIGNAFEGMLAEIVDGEGRFLPPGEIGELALGGPQVASGYWRDAELTARRFPVLEHPSGARVFFLTHDRAYCDDSGCFHFLGRLDHQVKIHGHRVELEEIDAHLRAITGAPAAAIAWPVKNGAADGVVAFVSSSAVSSDDIRQRMKQAVPWYMVPRRIVELEHLPLTSNGKVDRAALTRMLDP
jgi:amino acid adenylation domain-containing protein